MDTSVPSKCCDPIKKDIQWDIIPSALFDMRDCESDTDGRISIPGPSHLIFEGAYVEFDFEAVQRELTLAVQIVGEFLNKFRDEFLDNAWYLISKVYCRIHQKIDIRCVSNILSVSLSDSSCTQPPL